MKTALRIALIEWLALLLSIVLIDSARAAGPVLPLSAEDQQEIASTLGPGIVGTALPSEPIADASVYFPLVEKQSVYQLTNGDKKGTQQTLHVKQGKRPAGTPAWRFELSPTLAAFINQGAGGDLTMPSVSDTDEGVIIETTPANPFVLTGMKPGESRAFTQTVSVNYLDNPSKQDYAGNLSGTYTYAGSYEVTVPAGMFQAVMLRLDTAGKVGPAHTQDKAYYFLAPEIGVVAMISQEDVEAYWVIHIDTSTGKVLVSH